MSHYSEELVEPGKGVPRLVFVGFLAIVCLIAIAYAAHRVPVGQEDRSATDRHAVTIPHGAGNGGIPERGSAPGKDF